MDTNTTTLVENEYDDGVVCFGPVTEDQLNRYKRLPRRTVLPSDFELSQSFFEQDEDKKNDQSSVFDESNESTTCVDNSIIITPSTNIFDEEKEEIGTIELKQSFSGDSNLKFSSPCFSKCIANAKLMDTEVINRYIRMGSTSSNDSSLSEDQNKSTFEDETISFTDAQEIESIRDNYVFDDTSTYEHLSVSSVIEPSASSSQQNIVDDSVNVCTLIHCSQKDDPDLSICSDSELGDVTEDSIVADEYSVTPGKQRLFDLRVTKQSLRAKALVASAPFMDRIEETTTPILPKVLNSPSILNDISDSEIKERLNVSSVTELCHDTSEHFNQTSNENVFETSKFVGEAVGELLVSNNLKNMVSINENVDTIFDKIINTNKLSTDSRGMNINKSIIKTDQIENTLNDTVPIIDNEQYETMYTNKLSTNNKSIDLNESLNETDHIQTAINDTEQNFDDEKSMCIFSNKAIPTSDMSYYNDEEFSVAMEVDIKSTNTSVMDSKFDETIYINNLSTNRSMGLKETDHIQTAINDTVQNFDDEKSMCIISNKAIPTSDFSYYDDEELSVAMEVDIKSTNTSYVDKEFDETMYTNKPSTNNRSLDMNQSLNETNVEYTLNDTKQKFDGEKSTYIKSNIAIPTSVINNYNDEEFSVAMEVDIKSTNTSCMVKEIDETVCTHKLSINRQSTDLNKSLNETNVKNTLNGTEQNDDEKLSNIAIPTLGLIDHNNKEKNSIPTEVDIKSIDTSVVDKIFDETLYPQELSINNQNMDLNKSLNETKIENTLNGTEQNDDEKLSNIAIPTLGLTDYNNKEKNLIPTEVDIKSIDTSVVDKIFDETLYNQELSINNQNMDLNKSLNETNIENTLNSTDYKFDDEKSMNIMSNMAIPTSDVNEYNKEFSVAMELFDIKSANISCMDKELDETVYVNKLVSNNQSMVLNKSLNEDNIENTLNDTEHKFDDEKSMNSMAILASDVKGHNDEEFSVAMEVDIKSTNTSCVDKELDETIYANELVSNNQSMVLNKSLNEDNIENTLNGTDYKFDDEKSMNIMSNMAIPTSDASDHNDRDNSIATKIDIKSINTSIVNKIFDESMLINANKLLIDSRTIDCNKSLNETGSTSNNTEHRFMNNIQDTSVSAINFDDKLVLNKLDKSILKNTINSENSFVGINEVNITCNTSIEDPSCIMRQYLDFEQAVNEMCNDISSASCPGGKSNQPKESYDDETLEHLIEQTLSSDTFNLTKVNENFSNYDGSNLSVIIEDKSLETSTNNMEQHEDFVNPNNNVSITLESKVNETGMLNESTVVNTVATSSKSEVGLAYGTDVGIQVKANETEHNAIPMFRDELSKMELDTFTKIDKNLNNIPEDINEIHSTQNTLDENSLNPIANQITITDIPNSADFKLISNTEITQKNLTDQDKLLINGNQQQDVLDTTKNIDNSLEEFTNLEQMFNFGDNKKEKQVEYKTPKTQKLLDFSIVQQTPTFDNQAKKQKLLNFSIVDPTPILKSAQQVYPNENVINNDSLIIFSSVDDRMWNSEVVAKNEMSFKDFQNSYNDSSLNNLSTISPPDLELLADESIKANTSNFSNSSFDQTITYSNLNPSSYSCANNITQNSVTELNHVEPLMFINKHIADGELPNFLNQTIEQNESEQKIFYGEHCVAEATAAEVKSDLKLLSNTTSNKNIDFKEDLKQQLRFNSNEQAIVDFSIIDQKILENFELKKNTDITSAVESDRNVSNLIEMSLVTKTDEQSIILSKNPIIPIISDDRSEKSMHSSSDEINSTALHLKESSFLHNNAELLTDIQMNNDSLLMESPEKSSIIDSFHSIELDHVQEDNKRKMETTQEYDNNEKKMKVETETMKTPMSMLYKIKNMFRSSEKQPSCLNNTKENNFKSDKCYQKLNFNKFEENNDDFTKPITLKKSEVIVKSKIPCKVTDRSLTKNDEFNSSSLSSLNDNIKQKKTIPKFSGVPVLSDVSNSSNRKCPESRIPSKFQK